MAILRKLPSLEARTKTSNTKRTLNLDPLLTKGMGKRKKKKNKRIMKREHFRRNVFVIEIASFCVFLSVARYYLGKKYTSTWQ